MDVFTVLVLSASWRVTDDILSYVAETDVVDNTMSPVIVIVVQSDAQREFVTSRVMRTTQNWSI